jgi:hypothetical protein
VRGIVYTSKARVAFTATQLEALGEHAARANTRLDITGYLYYARGRFTQYIEGGDDAVNGLMGRIALDPRHGILRTLATDDFAARRFPEWRMHVLKQSDLVELRLEHLLTEFLDTMAMMDDPGPRTVATAWQLVDSIARLQARMDAALTAARRPSG